MIEVKIPAEIQEYKSKLIFGLSTRQFISIVGALLVGVPIGVKGREYVSPDLLMWIIIITVVPFAGYGFFKFKDMVFEDFMKAFILMNFTPQKRVYEDTDMNLFSSINEEIIAEDVFQQRVDAGEIESEEEGSV